MPYKVKIDVFEGPFDLLLHLVRVNEMDIYDISISEITKQYLAYIKDMEKLDLEIAGEFLVMAATLVNIKSRALMPPMSAEEAEEEEEIDEEAEEIRDAQELMRRLIEYRQFKELAVKLSRREEEQLRLFYRNAVLPKIEQPDQPQEVREDISVLFSAFARVLEYTEGRPVHHVLEEEFSVEEKIETVRGELKHNGSVALSTLVERCVSKQEIITLFLALLEICRQRAARIRQSENFKDIVLLRPDKAAEADAEDDDF